MFSMIFVVVPSECAGAVAGGGGEGLGVESLDVFVFVV